MLQVTLISNTDNKDGIIKSKANFRSLGVTLSGSEALLALNLAIELTIPSYVKFMLISHNTRRDGRDMNVTLSQTCIRQYVGQFFVCSFCM